MMAGKVRRMVGAAVLILGLASVTASAQVLISEVAWAGTSASSSDEWIELHNVADEPIDLTGWTLIIGETAVPLGVAEGSTSEVRNTMIDAGSFFLLERTDDATISDLEADVIYRGSLSNAGSDLVLLDSAGEIVDEVLFAESGWPAGTASDEDLSYATMERIGGAEVEAVWKTNDGTIRNGLDAEGNSLNGTPGADNSATILAASAPRIELVSSPAETELSRGIYVIHWLATDPDDSPSALGVSIYLSSDSGESWSLLVENLANVGRYPWDTSDLPSGDGFILRLVVEDPDGHLGETVSGPFAIESEEG
ncbi:lamin tail domain-containing protein [Candidatus Bipolaricaulota bacterium]